MPKQPSKIAILQTGHAPAALQPVHGDYGAMCADLVSGEHDTRIFAAVDGHLPADPDHFDAYVISGSRFGVNDGLEWIDRLKAFVRLAFSRDRKLIGLCFGHQLLADALGGAVRKNLEGPGIGIMTYRSLSSGEPDPVSLPAWHYDQVCKVPPQARVTMASDFCPVAGLAFGKSVVSFQAHPEFSTPYLADLIDHYGPEKLGADVAAAAERTIDQPADQRQIKELLQRHLHQ